MKDFTIESKIVTTENEIVELEKERIDMDNSLESLYKRDLNLSSIKEEDEILLRRRIIIKTEISEILYSQFLNTNRLKEANHKLSVLQNAKKVSDNC